MPLPGSRKRHRQERELRRNVRRTLESVQRTERMRASLARDEILRRPEYREGGRLAAFGYKVCSQGDEDGILAEIFRRVGVRERRFLEIGAGEGVENNTACLLLQGWRGSWIEADPRSAARIRGTFAGELREGRLALVEEAVDRESGARLVAEAAAEGELDLLSVDIDGNDYHVIEALEPIPARVLVAEYNAKFPPPIEWAMPYDPAHRWDESDWFGASLCALEALLRRKGFSLVGCSLTGVNAFFVRSELAAEHFSGPDTAAQHFEPAREWLSPGLGSSHPARRRSPEEGAERPRRRRRA